MSLLLSPTVRRDRVAKCDMAVQKMTFDIQVKSVFLGLFQYSAEAVTRDADVREITYSAT